MHNAKGEIEVIKFEMITLRSMQISARSDIAEAAAKRVKKLQEELDLLEAQERSELACKEAAPPLPPHKPILRPTL